MSVLLVAERESPPLHEVQQPLWVRPLPLPLVQQSFSSGVNFASPAGAADPLAKSSVDLASTFGTSTPQGPVQSSVQWQSLFGIVGGDLANGRYRR